MHKLALFPVLLLIVAAGCRDLEKNGRIPTELAIEDPSFSISTAPGDLSVDSPSTVCIAYDEQLASAQDAGDAESIATLETIIADACN